MVKNSINTSINGTSSYKSSKVYVCKWVLEGLSLVSYCTVVRGELFEIGCKVATADAQAGLTHTPCVSR